MCGIAGKFNFRSKDRVSEDLIGRMCGRIIHRGPDDQGIHVRNNIGLGMRRLSIIDVAGGHQPIHNEDKSIWIVFNGEIYNFKELRSELEEKDHHFVTQSDTEVIVHAYEAFGIDCLHKLRGMFAFALWDESRKRLVLARDRAGKKPLYYTVNGGSLLFASEIKSILEDQTVKRSVNVGALDLYLTHQYVPSPHSMFDGIHKLSPASFLICENGSIRTERYWKPDDSVETTESEEEICHNLRIVLKESIKLRMISDVPLGAFLSGGIDSSIVVALMAEQSRLPIKTFSIGFNEKEFSELRYARIIADRFGTDHHEMIVTPKVADLIPKLVWHYNEPFGDSSAIPTFYLSQMTRESVKVALSGDGGDELFAGYTKYPVLKEILDAPFGAAVVKRLIRRILPRAPVSWIDAESTLNRMLRSLRVRTMTMDQRNTFWGTTFDRHRKDHIYSKRLRKMFQEHDPEHLDSRGIPPSLSLDPVARILFRDFMRYLPDDLLVKVDVASMANSLEVRCPFLDHHLVELAMTIPVGLKIQGSRTKHILKKAFSDVLPNDILHREKAGFAIPLDDWLRNDLRLWSRDIVLDNDMAEFFNMGALDGMLKNHYSGRTNEGGRIWSLVNFSLWHKMFIRNQAS